MKHLSGYQKKDKKKKGEEIAQSLRGSLNKYFGKSSNDVNENKTTEEIVTNETNEQVVPNENETTEEIVTNETNEQVRTNENETNENETSLEIVTNKNACLDVDIFDPRVWDTLDRKMID